jgi:hypothetical protein
MNVISNTRREHWLYIRVFMLLCLLKTLKYFVVIFTCVEGPPWSWSYGGWIYNYICKKCVSSSTLWVRIPLRRGVLDITWYDQFVCELLQVGSFLWVVRFPPTIKLTATIQLKCCWKWPLNTITLTSNLTCVE